MKKMSFVIVVFKNIVLKVSIKFAALVSLDAVYKMARTASVMQVLDVVLGSMSSIRYVSFIEFTSIYKTDLQK